MLHRAPPHDAPPPQGGGGDALSLVGRSAEKPIMALIITVCEIGGHHGRESASFGQPPLVSLLSTMTTTTAAAGASSTTTALTMSTAGASSASLTTHQALEIVDAMDDCYDLKASKLEARERHIHGVTFLLYWTDDDPAQGERNNDQAQDGERCAAAAAQLHYHAHPHS